MLYKLLHRIFGWDYIHWKNFADWGVARVHVAGDGKAWYWRYKSSRRLDVIKTPEQVVWLTCRPSKYLKQEK